MTFSDILRLIEPRNDSWFEMKQNAARCMGEYTSCRILLLLETGSEN